MPPVADCARYDALRTSLPVLSHVGMPETRP
jgi:hypothetical protein